MPTLPQYAAYRELEALAKNPFSLHGLTPERVLSMHQSALGFTLLFAGERVDGKVLSSLFALAKEAKCAERLLEMQKGAKLNVGEKRGVLHTAMRDLFSKPLCPEATYLAEREVEKLTSFLEKKGSSFTHLVQVGIGGSDLGPRALALALEPFYLPGRHLHFISNVDPDDAASILSEIDLKKSLFVIVSKSGTTLETLTNEAIVRARLKQAGLDPKEHCVAVTGEKSPMDDPTRYLASFYMWDFVGGRYSATSMVGAVALAFALGMKGFKELLLGAHEMDRHALEVDPAKNLPLLMALFSLWNRHFLRHPTLAIIPYSHGLRRFAAHLQQVEMESNGKQVDLEGKRVSFPTAPVLWGEEGTNGQHSFFQMLHQGTDIVPMELIGFALSQRGEDLTVQGTTSQQKLIANLIAQSIALSQGAEDPNLNKAFFGNRPHLLLIGKQLTPHTMGRLLALYEHRVAFEGFLWGINSFDQEGVQLGKRLSTEVLDLMAHGKGHPLAASYLRLFLNSGVIF